VKHVKVVSFSQQLGYIRHPAGQRIASHVHNPVPPEVHATLEVPRVEARAASRRPLLFLLRLPGKPHPRGRRYDSARQRRPQLRALEEIEVIEGETRSMKAFTVRNFGTHVTRRASNRWGGHWMSDAPTDANAWYAWLLARQRAGSSPA